MVDAANSSSSKPAKKAKAAKSKAKKSAKKTTSARKSTTKASAKKSGAKKAAKTSTTQATVEDSQTAKSPEPARTVRVSRFKGKASKPVVPDVEDGPETVPEDVEVFQDETSETEALPAEDDAPSDEPSAESASPALEQALAHMAASRSKPVVMEDEAEEPPEAADAPEEAEAEAPARMANSDSFEAAPVVAGDNTWDLVAQFLVLANQPDWDRTFEKVRAGSWGAPIVGAALLELALQGHLMLHRGRFQVADPDAVSGELAPLARQLAELGDVSAQGAMERLGKRLSLHLVPWKQRMDRQGLARFEARKKFGLFDASTFVVRPETQDLMVRKLTRMLAGSGVVDARTVALLGLVEASGLLESLVPSSALAFNRKRIKGLLAGRDMLGYKVDPSFKAASDALLGTILDNVRILCGRA